MQKFLLIAAGGKSTRMAENTPKQFISIAGKPLLVHVFDTFQKYNPNINIVLVLPRSLHAEWKIICEEFSIYTSHELADSGPTRFHSVKNGLQHIPNNTIVAVHDAARPLASLNLIAKTFDIAGKFGNAIPVITPNDSIRIINNGNSTPLLRKNVRLVQTPQCFHSSILKKAYKSNYEEGFTDDASVVEAYGERLFLVDGCPKNIKITTPVDLTIAEGLL